MEVSPPLTPVLVTPLTLVLDEEEARQEEPKEVESPPPTPSTHIPLETPPVVVVEDIPEQIRADAARIIAFGLAGEAEALRLAQVSYERGDYRGYVAAQINHALTDPGIRNRAAAFKANMEAGREFVSPPSCRPSNGFPAGAPPPAGGPTQPSTGTPPTNEPPSTPERIAGQAAWRGAVAYLRAACPTDYERTLRYVQLAEIDSAGGRALLIVPNEHLRREVAERLAETIARALHQAGQPPLRIIAVTQQVGAAVPRLAAPEIS